MSKALRSELSIEVVSVPGSGHLLQIDGLFVRPTSRFSSTPAARAHGSCYGIGGRIGILPIAGCTTSSCR